MSYEVVANVHYGFVGQAAEIPGDLLLVGAGLAQYMDHHKDNPEAVGPWYLAFDQPKDSWAVYFGISLYASYGEDLDQLTPEALQQVLTNYVSILGSYPEE